MANSLPQPRQKSKTHELRDEEKSSMQRKGKRQSTDEPANDTPTDVTQGRKRKRGNAHDANGVDKQVATRSSKRHLRSTVEKSS